MLSADQAHERVVAIFCAISTQQFRCFQTGLAQRSLYSRAGLNEDSRLGFRVSREARRAHVKVITLFAFGVESACAPVPVRIQPEVSVCFEVAFCFRLRTDSLSRVEPNTRAVAMATSEPRAAPCCSCAETPVFFGAESIRSE